jgi:uncharacterized membrane protein (DUF373 family)
MIDSIKTFHRIMYLVLLILLGIVLVVSVINLGIIVVMFLVDDGGFILESHEIIQIFGFFLLVLIGVEFFESILTYLRDHVIHVEVIVMVAMTAVARKVILLDSEVSDMHLIGLGFLILSLGIAYYLIRQSNREKMKEELAKRTHEA